LIRDRHQTGGERTHDADGAEFVQQLEQLPQQGSNIT
jgi:hypothetical protein